MILNVAGPVGQSLDAKTELLIVAALLTFAVACMFLIYLFLSNLYKTIKQSRSVKPTRFQKFASYVLPSLTIAIFLVWLYYSANLDRRHELAITSMLGRLFWILFISSVICAVVLKFKMKIIEKQGGR